MRKFLSTILASAMLLTSFANVALAVGNATRAETAVFVYRLYNLLNK